MTYELKHPETDELYRLRIKQDTDAQNPREFEDHISKMVCFHGRYKLPNESEFKRQYYNSWGGLEKKLIEDGAKVILPIYMLDHSGLSVSTAPFGGMNGHFDSGQIGFIYLTSVAILDGYGWKTITAKRREVIEKDLQQEIETYDQYLKGDIWGFTLLKQNDHDEENWETDWDTVDSCWGFYGSDLEKNGILEHLPNWAQEQIKTQR